MVGICGEDRRVVTEMGGGGGGGGDEDGGSNSGGGRMRKRCDGRCGGAEMVEVKVVKERLVRVVDAVIIVISGRDKEGEK